jgi:serine/threonine protein kinase
MPLKIGDHIGDYEVIGFLGAGGMGSVYKVRNVLSNRVEGLKVLLPDLAANNDLSERFLREIRLQATLVHPNIASLYTALKIDNQLLMFMEFVEGTPLNELLSQQGVSVSEALDYTSQILSALDYAHQRGVVHRDIKPSNMIRTPSGVVKLLDFGIARLAMDRKLTATGGVLGSIHYMSPEQIQAVEVDARSDIYAVGICLYEMVTRKKPFDADSDFALMAAHIHQPPPPPIDLDPALPPELNDIILIAIAKNPDERFQSAAAMRNAIESVRVKLGFSTQPTPTPIPAQQPAVPFKDPITATLPRAAAPAPPPPAMAPPIPQPAIPPPAARGSRRGLYMALGSLVTVAVLVAAIVFIPRFMRARAGAATAQTTTQSAEVTPTPAPSPTPEAPTPTPATTADSQPTPTVTPEPMPVTPATPPAQVPADKPHREHLAAAPPPQQQMSAAPPVQQQQAPPAESQAHRAAVAELHENYDQLSVRVTSVHSGLQSLQNQMGGMGLRADMREAATRMDALFQKADRQIQAGDVDAATKTLENAERVTSQLEKFLGQ